MKQQRKAFGFITTAGAALISSLALVLFAGFSGANATTDSATPTATSSSTPSATGSPDASIPPGQDRYLVTTSASATDAIASKVTDAGGFVIAQYDKSMTGFVATMTAQTATTLSQLEGVKRVERDAEIHANARSMSTANDGVAGGAVVTDPGCVTNSLPRGDDVGTAAISLGFSANWFGTSYTKLLVNNNGGISFDDGKGAFTDYLFNIATATRPMVLPLGTDLDTRNTSTTVVKYGELTNAFGGHTGFCVNYVQVGHYDQSVPFYSAQLLILNRSDRRAGDVDIVFNYDFVSPSSSSAALEIGYANPANRSTSFQMPGSGASPSAFVDGGSAALTTHKSDLIEASASVYTSKNGRYAYGIINGAAPTATPTPSNTPTPTTTPTAGCLTSVPAGTQGCAPWGLDRIDQPNANLDGLFTPAGTGSGVVAYVVDTGIYAAHSDFTGRISSGYTAISDGIGTDDCNGHGTHVAGTIGGTTYGVAKQVTLVPVRVLDCTGSGFTSNVIAGINWVIADHTSGPAVLNMSLGGGYSKTLNDAVLAAVADGITVVVAAGNSSVDACNSSPASEPTAITVGATSSNDARASFSNYGTCLDLFAPGVNITSAGIAGTRSAATFSGTSMASPCVAGAAAVYLGLRNSATPAQVSSGLLAAATQGVVTDALSTNSGLLYARSFAGLSASATPTASVSTTPAVISGAGSSGGGGDSGGDAGPVNLPKPSVTPSTTPTAPAIVVPTAPTTPGQVGILNSSSATTLKVIVPTQTLAANGTLSVAVKIAAPPAGVRVYLRADGKLFGPAVVSRYGTLTFTGIPNISKKYEVVHKRGNTTLKVTSTVAVGAKQR